MVSACFENLVATVSSFLSWLDENSVAALVTGLTDSSYLYPLNVSASNTLVSWF